MSKHNRPQRPDKFEDSLSLRQRVFRAEEALARANMAYVRAWLRYLASEDTRVLPAPAAPAAEGEAPAPAPMLAPEGTTTSADLGWTVEPRAPSPAEYMAARAHKTILVVDDEADIRYVIRALLEGAGYRVLEAGDGQEALDLVCVGAPLAVGPAATPAVIILDMLMVPVDGWAFARLYRALPAPPAPEPPAPHGQGQEGKAPILVLTAAHDAERRARDIGASGWCGKPFRLETLLAKVDRLALAPPLPLAPSLPDGGPAPIQRALPLPEKPVLPEPGL